MVSKNLSVCLSVTIFDLNYLWTGKIELADFFALLTRTGQIGCSAMISLCNQKFAESKYQNKNANLIKNQWDKFQLRLGLISLGKFD